jgi:uncharacterized protein (DUF1778 family)
MESKRRGRPAVEDPRDYLRSIRLSSAELDQVERAAKLAGVNVATFIRTAAIKAALSTGRSSD